MVDLSQENPLFRFAGQFQVNSACPVYEISSTMGVDVTGFKTKGD